MSTLVEGETGRPTIRRPHRKVNGQRHDMDVSTHRTVVYEVSREENIMQRQVREFMTNMSQVVGDKPGFRDTILRRHLMASEFKETLDAIDAEDFTEAVDGLCDILYVVFGTFECWGIDAATMFDEVHRTNMLKDPANRDDHGKVLKPQGWAPPRLAEMIEYARQISEVDESYIQFGIKTYEGEENAKP